VLAEIEMHCSLEALTRTHGDSTRGRSNPTFELLLLQVAQLPLQVFRSRVEPEPTEVIVSRGARVAYFFTETGKGKGCPVDSVEPDMPQVFTLRVEWLGVVP